MTTVALSASLFEPWTLSDFSTPLLTRFNDLAAAIRLLSECLHDALSRVRSYLSKRVDSEPNPYYKGRYLVALLVCAYNHVSHPYEVSEVLFRDSRFAAKVDRWMAEQCERFPYLSVRFDGTLVDWLPPKKTVQAEKLKKAKAA
jgi:hypothetical protein